VIAYLEQLEQDLVEAIDRREVTGEREAGRRLTGAAHSAARSLAPRPAWLVVAALAIGIVVGVALVQSGMRDERAVQPAPSPPANVPPGNITVSPTLRIFGNLRLDGSTWRGQAQGPGGTGTLTLTDAPQIPADPNNPPPPLAQKLRFRWDSPTGTLAGCIINTIYRRPHGRWVWDGPGAVVTATGALKRYRGAEASLGGRTMVTTPQRAYIGIGSGGNDRRPGPDC
jgi:hypothetical protein